MAYTKTLWPTNTVCVDGTKINNMEDGIENNDTSISSGWIPANETWTYASATTITVPSGALSKYSKGDKIKLTQATVKYFYIIDVTDTLLTITGGTSYTLTSATITDNYYSHSDNPIGFPQWFNWTPTVTYAGGTTDPTSSTLVSARFTVQGKTTFFHFNFNIVAGSSNRVLIAFSLPIPRADSYSMHYASKLTCSTTIFYGTAYSDDNTVKFNHQINADGYARADGFYEI